MNSKIVKSGVLGLAAVFYLAQAACAGKLDVSFIQTSPTKALVYSIAFPGGGHYYLSRINPKYKGKFYLYLALGIGSGLFLNTAIKSKNSTTLLTAALAAGGIKVWEFGSVTDDAEGERLKWLKDNFKAGNTADVPVKGSGN